MKKIIFAIAIVATMAQFSNAQEKNKFRAGLDLGYAIPDGGGGILFAFEPKYNIADNMSVGLRIEAAALAKNVSNASAVDIDDVAEVKSSLSTSTSYFGTFDYYFNSGSSSFAPFVGAGVGYSTLANLGFDEFAEIEYELDGKFGGLVRVGAEFGKFRLAATYNLIGKSEFVVDEDIKLDVKNSYIGISLGFYVGGGKWNN